MEEGGDLDFLNELQELSKQLPPEKINESKISNANSNLPGFGNDFGEFNLNEFFKNFKMDDSPQFQENLNKLKENLETITSQLKQSTQFGNPTNNNNSNGNNTQFSVNDSNPFTNAYSKLNQEDFSKQFSTFANEEINNDELNKLFNLTKDYIQSGKEPNENEQKEMCDKVIDYMLKNNLFSQVFTSMQNSINNNYEKNKSTLTAEEDQQYKQSLKYTADLLAEASKVHPDKTLIINYIYNLQKISMIDLQNLFPFN